MTAPASIDALVTRRITVPLRRPWAADVPSVTVIETVVTDSDGAVGHGFSWTPAIGAASVQAMLDTDIRDWAIGRPATTTGWDALWARLHEAGSGGVTTIAMAGLDLALWDLAGQRSDRSVAAMLGTRRDSVAAYGSGVNLHYPQYELLQQVDGWMDAGFDAIKIKVGSPDLARDLRRVEAVRSAIGDRRLMLDANQRWNRDEARVAIAALARFGPSWIEEPLRADDLEGYRDLVRAVDVPIACGENLATIHRFREFAGVGVQVLQPNIVRVGGITPALRIASEIEDRGASVALHLLPEVSTQVAVALRTDTAVEVVDGALFVDSEALAGPAPIRISAGRAGVTGAPGLGIRFTIPNEEHRHD